MPTFLNPFSWFNSDQNIDKEKRKEDLDKAIRKASMIDAVGDTRSRKTDNLAVSTIKHDWHDKTSDYGFVGYWQSPHFREYIKFTINDNKFSRINDYRDLGNQEKLEACIHEYAISCAASHDKQKTVTAKLEGDYDEEIRDIINKEMNKVRE